MSHRNIVAFVLTIISLCLLYPGLFSPILMLEISFKVPVIGTQITLFERTQSVVESIKTLYEEANWLVGTLILVFSIVVPITKAIILMFVFFMKESILQTRLYRFVYAIGKWAMADVFVVGVFIAFLTTKTTEGVVAELHEGFYYFLGYCLVSLVSIQLMKVSSND